MKNIILLLILGLFAQNGFSQNELPCVPGNPTVIGGYPPNVTTLTPPTNPKNPKPTPVYPNDRLVYWIHRLGGNIDSWARVGQATQYQSPGQQVPGYPARKVTSLQMTYSQFSFSGAASSLHNMIMAQGDPASQANNITDKSINFIVAHSQGGLAARATDKMYDELGNQVERRFGGIVTFGTPHGGAMIINNKDQFEIFASEACSALLSGPLEDAIQANPVVDFFVPNESFQSIKDGLCSFMGEHVAPIAFKDQFQDITEDYKIGAAPIGELNSHSSSIPHVAFYGVEEEPVLYRVMYNLKVKTPNNFEPFKADDDQVLVDKFNELLNKYTSKYETYSAQLDLLESLGMPCGPVDWILNFNNCQQYDPVYWKTLRKKDKWFEGVYWLNHSNAKFKHITGADQSHWVTTNTCTCNGSSFPTNQPSCPPGCTMTGSTSYWQTEEHPSDGVILAE